MKTLQHIENKTLSQHAFSHLRTIVGCAILYSGALIGLSKIFTMS